MQELSEALTTAKSMVGRRLLSCSDLNWNGPFGLRVGFESQCNQIVEGFKATWDAARKEVEDAWADFTDLTVGWLDDIGDGIRCASTPLAPR